MARSDAIGKEPTIDEINAGEVASFKGFATKDGAVSDGAQTSEEAAVWGARAAAAKAAPAARAAAKAPVAESEDGETPEQKAEREAAAESPEDKAAREAREAKMTPEQKAAAARQAKASGPRPNKKTASDRVAEIKAATAEMRSAERALAALKQSVPNADIEALRTEIANLKAAQLTPGGKPATVVDKDAPNSATYEYGELDTAYIRDLARYETRKEFAANQAEQDRKAQTTTATAAQAAFEQKVSTFGTEGSKLYDDFQQVVIEGARDKAYPLSPTIGELLFDSEQGPDIAYYLASNPDEAVKLAAKSPAAQAKEFGRLEAVFSSTSQDAPVQEDQTTEEGEEPPARQVQTPPAAATRAPQPPQHRARAAGGKPTVSGATTDFAAFERLATQQ